MLRPGVSGVLDTAHASFRRTVVVRHVAAESSGEPLDIPGRRLVAEDEAQRVVGVIRLLWRRQHVRQGPPDVIAVRHAVATYVGKESRGREPSARG